MAGFSYYTFFGGHPVVIVVLMLCGDYQTDHWTDWVEKAVELSGWYLTKSEPRCL